MGRVVISSQEGPDKMDMPKRVCIQPKQEWICLGWVQQGTNPDMKYETHPILLTLWCGPSALYRTRREKKINSYQGTSHKKAKGYKFRWSTNTISLSQVPCNMTLKSLQFPVQDYFFPSAHLPKRPPIEELSQHPAGPSPKVQKRYNQVKLYSHNYFVG